jgi:hypothetical protein
VFSWVVNKVFFILEDTKMKKLMFVMLCVGLGLVLCGTTQAANLLLNSGFEINGGYGGSAAANWTETLDGSATGVEGWANQGVDSAWGMAVYWWNNGGNGGFYQSAAVTAGQVYDFKCFTLRDGGGQWLPDPENPGGPTIWVPNTMTGTYTMKIDWLAGTTLLGTTSMDITYTMGTADWIQLTLSGTAPTGADTANVGFDAAGVNNAGKFDNASFDVPEPVTMTILGLGSLFLARRRK